MKVPENWLREHVALDVDGAAIAERCNMIGLEVEAIECIGGALDGVVVATIVACEKHPQAERLQLCHVDAGGERQVIVCGAPNARPGIKVPLATIGAHLPGGITIKAAKLRGIESHGMLCSARELGIDNDASGLLELAPDAPLGTPLAQWLDLPARIFDLGLTPNRGDCLSIRGVARDIAAAFAVPVTSPVIADVAASSQRRFDVQLQAGADCPRYAARVIEGIDAQAASPAWLRQRLQRGGVRPLSLLVDVTNYVMLELGQPLHAFDAATLSGPIVVRNARASEKLTLLDEREVTLDPEFVLITDNDRPLALGGIMGGFASRVTESTRDVLLEAAHFAPAAISGRARRLGMHTEASHRFERGVDPALPALALQRATQLIVAVAGGQPGPISMAEHPQHLPQTALVPLRRARLERVLGIRVADADVERILRALGMTVNPQNEGWLAAPPSWRFDIAIEEDLIEEVARIHGYDAIPTSLPRGEIRVAAPHAVRAATTRLREHLLARDYREAVTYTFVPAELLATWQMQASTLALANPLSADFAVMRTSLLPGLVQALVANRNRQQERVRLFEIGRSYHAGADGPREVAQLAAVACGAAYAEQWGEPSRGLDFFDIKGDLQALLASDEATTWSFDDADLPPYLHPGRSARAMRDGVQVGVIGVLHPRLAAALDVGAEVCVFEIALAPLLRSALPMAQPLSRYPSLRRDIAIEVGDDVSWDRIRTCVRSAVGASLAELRLFDQYRGSKLQAGQRSLAMGLILQDDSRTLTDEDADRDVSLAVTALKNECRATLRGKHGAD